MLEFLHWLGRQSHFVGALTVEVIFLRLGLAVLFGGLVGLERERHHKPAGFRTYILVCLGAASVSLLQDQLRLELLALPSVPRSMTLDLGRLGAQVWWWWQWGYDKDQDVFYRHRRPCFGGRLRREEWPAADFCALYWEPLDYSDRIYVPNRVWLAGRAGGEDVPLADFDEAYVLAERLALASGLPLRHRWPPAPDPITRL